MFGLFSSVTMILLLCSSVAVISSGSLRSLVNLLSAAHLDQKPNCFLKSELNKYTSLELLDITVYLKRDKHIHDSKIQK